MTGLILTTLLFGAPSDHQVKRHSAQIVNYLKRTDPRILSNVVRQMGWVSVGQCRKQNQESRQRNKNKTRRNLEEINQWELDMLLDMAGIRTPKKRK